MRKSIAELRTAQVTFKAHEAVAIAQQLISALRDRPDMGIARPPYGPPCAENVFLHDDGAVTCTGCVATPVVSEVGILLEEMLPGGSLRVPGGLRYTIARALLNVDVPPFDSLDEFARDLARHEHGSREAAVLGVLARARTARALAPVVPANRRRMNESASELRRALREADARLYEQQRAVPVYDVNVPPSQMRAVPAAAACLAAGLLLICTGEFMHRQQRPLAVTQTAPGSPALAAPEPSGAKTPDAAQVTVAPPVAPARVAAASDRGIITVHDVPRFGKAAGRPEPRRISTKRPARVTIVTTARGQSAARSPQKGVLDKLKLRWLRKAFTMRSDL